MDYGIDGPSALLESIKKRELFVIESDFLVIKVISQNYDVPLSELKTAQGILHWAWHLSEKSWMDTELLRYFIEIAGQYGDIDVFNAERV